MNVEVVNPMEYKFKKKEEVKVSKKISVKDKIKMLKDMIQSKNTEKDS